MELRDDEKALLEQLTAPATTDVARAKALILNELKGGAPQQLDHLVRLLPEAEGITDETTKEDQLDVNDARRDHARVRYLRMSRAAVEATAQLEAAGTIVPAVRAAANKDGTGVSWHIQLLKRQLSGKHPVGAGRPLLEKPAYRLTRPDAPAWAMDTDFLLTGAEGLHLPAKTVQCLEEALRAYRNGLYFASLSLLGAGSEGAWFYLAGKVSPQAPKVRKLLDGPVTTGKQIQSALANFLRDDTDFRKYVDELVHSASLLRRIRNYGIHPGEEDSHLSEYFDEIKCGALLLSARDYLHRLSEIAGSPKWTTGAGQDTAPRD